MCKHPEPVAGVQWRKANTPGRWRHAHCPPSPSICAQALIVLKVGEELLLPELWGGFVRKPQAALPSPGRQNHLDPVHSGAGQTWGEAERAAGHRRAEWQDHPSLASTPFSRSLQHN